jgi:predicted  nucleic acid-binding Zn-ribbon protein
MVSIESLCIAKRRRYEELCPDCKRRGFQVIPDCAETGDCEKRPAVNRRSTPASRAMPGFVVVVVAVRSSFELRPGVTQNRIVERKPQRISVQS